MKPQPHSDNAVSQPRLSDLIEVRPIPAVVQADDVRALRQPENGDAARDFVCGFLGYDERSRHALDSAVRSLGSSGGGAWFFNGVFGSGKSHLLGVLALLADGAGNTAAPGPDAENGIDQNDTAQNAIDQNGAVHGAFSALHPHLAPALNAFAPRLVVHCSLDEYPASKFSLEEIFWREVTAEWKRRGLAPAALQPGEGGARGETFALMEEALGANGLHGLVICIDELSLFLAGREHRGLQNDAAFLQFLGQRARRRTVTPAPLWVFAALQKTVEDIGDVDSYAISQIRDRYTTLPLSLAHLPSLIEHRLVIRKNAPALAELCDQTYGALLRALPRLDFGREEWQRLYPFHPSTVSLLESAASRFLSRTRSAVLFCSSAIESHRDSLSRIAPDALFDFLEPELAAHPDLRPLATTWRNWQRDLNDIAADAAESQYLLSVMKALLLHKIAGASPSVVQIANATALDARLPGEGNYQYAQILLEKLRERGGSLVVERRDGRFNDRYAIDFGARIGEMARRFTANALHTLPIGDRRIAAYVLACCREEALPLASLQNAPSLPTLWRNTPRTIRLEIAALPPAPDVLANRLAALLAPDGDDLALWIVPPFEDGAAADDESNPGARIVWRDAMRDATKTLEEARWRGALVWWMPRAASRDEWQLAREATAQHLLLADPQLLDNRRGRAVLDFLKNGQAERETVLSRLAARLLREGTISTGAGIALDAAELAGGESWSATVEALADLALPGVFPHGATAAPRLRVLTSSNAEALGLEILRRPADAPYFAASLERAVRAVAAPLGVAVEERGRWKIATLREDLAREIRDFTEASESAATLVTATLAAVETHLAKSAWGLNPELTRLAVCALLRSGELAAFDTRGAALETREIGMPLRRSVHTLRPGRLLDAATWAAVQERLGLLTGEKLGPLSFAEQERARGLLAAWRADTHAQAELVQARLHQLRRQLGHDRALWPHTEEAIESASQLLHATGDGPAFDVLTRLASNTALTRASWQAWQNLVAQLDERHASLLEAYTFIAHSEMVAPPELQAGREELLARFGAGEALLADEALPALFAAWRERYAALYADWHRAQNAPERFISLRRLASSAALRAALRLSGLAHRDFPQGRQVQQLITDELEKGCTRNGALLSEPVCPLCRLGYGRRVVLTDIRELEAPLLQCADALRAAIGEEAVRDYLARHEQGAALLQWSAANAPLDTLLPLLNDTALATLDAAFQPRRRVKRTWSALQTHLKPCRTRAELEHSFRAWLDGGEGLQGDDEVVLED